MNGWLSRDALASRMGHKILIAGLSQAGKTAIKRIFFFKQQTTDVDQLPATIDYERMAVSISDVRISIVDLGGQKVFIKRFLNKFSPFIFSSVYIFIFVIDVAARSTRNDAIKYFSSCLDRLQKYSPNAEYFVFLHKNDLVRQSPNYESIHAQFKEQFQLETQKKLHFFRTTIFNPKSITEAFGRIFEILVPDIARSKYVEGQTIGEIEEFAHQYAALPSQNNQISETDVAPLTPSSTSGSSSVPFDTLQSQLHEILIKEDVEEEKITSSIPSSIQSEIQLGSEETKEAISLDSLQTQLQGILNQENTVETIASSSTIPQSSSTLSSESEQQQSSVTLDTLQRQLQESLVEEEARTTSPILSPSDPGQELILETFMEHFQSDSEVEEEKLEDFSLDIEFLTHFYGIKWKQAAQIVEKGYNEIFEVSAKAGVPIPLVLDVLLKYIPYLRTKGLTLENQEVRLSEIFFAYLNKVIKEEEIFKTLILLTKASHLSIDEIITTHFIPIREEKKQLEKKKAQEVTPSPEEVEELPVGVIPFSFHEKLGFKIIKLDYNCRLIFYHGKRQISTNLVPTTITIPDLKYLLNYEVLLPIKENYSEFVEKIVPIIFNKISKPEKLAKSKEIREKLRKRTLLFSKNGLT